MKCEGSLGSLNPAGAQKKKKTLSVKVKPPAVMNYLSEKFLTGRRRYSSEGFNNSSSSL